MVALAVEVGINMYCNREAAAALFIFVIWVAQAVCGLDSRAHHSHDGFDHIALIDHRKKRMCV